MSGGAQGAGSGHTTNAGCMADPLQASQQHAVRPGSRAGEGQAPISGMASSLAQAAAGLTSSRRL